tara:strand:- start:136 stop:906 length:771 start_codon:yes stop_codon:yes gene_type:complete
MNHLNKDRVVIIAGSSKGIGYKIAEELMADNAKVVITGRNAKNLESSYNKLKKKYNHINILKFCGDISDEKFLNKIKKSVIKSWGKIDGLVANAGNGKKVNKEKVEDWKWYYDNNYLILEKFVNFFIKDKALNNSSIVFISSIAGIHDLGAHLGYKSAKRNIIDYSQFLAKILSSRKIRVNTVSPGNIFFKGGNWSKKLQKNEKLIRKYIKENVPLNSFGRPEDIAIIVAYLLSTKSKFVTGANFVIDGGQILNHV